MIKISNWEQDLCDLQDRYNKRQKKIQNILEKVGAKLTDKEKKYYNSLPSDSIKLNYLESMISNKLSVKWSIQYQNWLDLNNSNKRRQKAMLNKYLG